MSNKLVKRSGIASGPVRYKIQGREHEPTGLLLAIDYEEAPVPDRYYVANWFAILEKDLEVIISFGDASESDNQLRSRIDIVFPSMLFLDQLWKSSRQFQETLEKFLETMGSKADHGQPGAKLVTDKLQRLKSNNVLMVLQGTECLMDFFYISPKDMWSKPRRGERIDLEAVVRIMLSPTLLLGFFKACEMLADRLTTRFANVRRKEDLDENLESEFAQ